MAAPTSTSMTLLGVLREELRPFEGRLGLSLRMTLACMLVVLVAMSQHVPEAALSCYLIFFASRNNAGSGILIAVALIVAASVGILCGVVLLQLAADEPMMRLSLLIGFTFAGMYFSQATRIGPIAATVGFIFAFVMTLNDIVPVPELLSRALSWMWVVVFFPMAALILINALAGPNPARLARRGLAERLEVAAGLLRGSADARGRGKALLAQGTAELDTFGRMGGLFGYFSKEEARRLAAMAPSSHRLLALAVATSQPDPASADRLDRLAEGVAHGRAVSPSPVLTGRDQYAMHQLVEQLASIWAGRHFTSEPAQAKTSLLAPDAFTNPVYLQFALKALLAVLITYVIYTAWDWFEVHTAMITCFYVALGSAGETLHKASLRIAGCLIGAAMGIASIIFFMPHMTDIGQLLVLVGVGSFMAAWVSNGSGRIQYMGWQMALAFFLCVLPGFGPSFDVAVATNRVLGILIGNVVVTLVFLGIWPVSVASGFSVALGEAIAPLRAALTSSRADLAPVWPHLAEARRLGALSVFEVNRLRIQSAVLPHAAAILTGIDGASDTLVGLQSLRQSPRYLAGAPRCVQAATLAYEACAAQFLDVAASAMVTGGPQTRARLTETAARSAGRLERLGRLSARLGEPRAAWRRDLNKTMALYRDLQSGFSATLSQVL